MTDADIELQAFTEREIKADVMMYVVETSRSVRERTPGRTWYELLMFVVFLGTLGLMIWMAVGTNYDGKSTGALNAVYRLYQPTATKFAANHHNVVYNPYDNPHHFRVSGLYLIPFVIMVFIWVLTFVINGIIVWRTEEELKHPWWREVLEGTFVQPRLMGFSLTTELSYAIGLPFIEVGLLLATGYRDTFGMVMFTFVAFAWSGLSFTVESQSIHLIKGVREYLARNRRYFALSSALPFILAICMFVPQAIVLCWQAFSYPSGQRYGTMIWACTIVWVVLKGVIMIFQMFYYGYIAWRLPVVKNISEYYNSYMSNPYYYHFFRLLLYTLIVWLITIYLNYDAKGHEQLPDWI